MQRGNPLYRWTYRGDHKILITAVAFGLGPQIAAENLLIDLQITKEYDTIEWHEEGLEQIAPFLEIKLLLNFGVVSPLPEFVADKRVWIDCVDWLRTGVPRHIQEYDLLLRETFFPSRPGGDRGDPLKWHDIQPIIRTPKRAAKPDRDLIVLSFGGITTPYSTTVHSIDMPMAFLRATLRYLTETPQKRLVAFLPGNLIEACNSNNLNHERLSLRRLNRKDFQEAMSRCGLLICQPGLYTPFEAIKMHVPFVLTYPMSFTQDRQAKKFRNFGIEARTAPWTARKLADPCAVDIEEVEAFWFSDSTMFWDAACLNEIEDSIYSTFIGILANHVENNFYNPRIDRMPTILHILTSCLGEIWTTD